MSNTPAAAGLVAVTPTQIKRLTGVNIRHLNALKERNPMESTVVVYDTDMANESIKFVVPSRQRRKKPAHIENLTGSMHRDEFDPTGDSLVYGILPYANGAYDMLLDNGQHRMHALSKTPNKKYRFPVVVRLFKTDAERRQWFALQDRGRVRTASDQSRILGLDQRIIELTEKAWLSQVLAAMKWIGNGLQNTKELSSPQMSALVEKYADAMKVYHEMASYAPPKKIKNVLRPQHVLDAMKWADKMHAAAAIAPFLVLIASDRDNAISILNAIRGFALGHTIPNQTPMSELFLHLIGASYAAGADREENITRTVELIQAARGREAPYIDWGVSNPRKTALES